MRVFVACFVGLAVALGCGWDAAAISVTLGVDNAGFEGDETGNSAAVEEFLAGISADVVEVYKSEFNEGGADDTEEKTFADAYETVYFDFEEDSKVEGPSSATISWDGGSDPFISGTPIYLFAKDGNHEPAWYAWQLTPAPAPGDGSNRPWNGQDDIVVTGLWPNGGSISHLSIFAGGVPVPESGATLGLLGLALLACRRARSLSR